MQLRTQCICSLLASPPRVVLTFIVQICMIARCFERYLSLVACTGRAGDAVVVESLEQWLINKRRVSYFVVRN